jgi:DNA-binding GntR family transcriptional regulator
VPQEVQRQTAGGQPPTAGDSQTSPSGSASRPTAGRSLTARSIADPPHDPAYLLIADAIAEQIAAGLYRAGDQLPTEPQLRTRFGVSPVTVRRAVTLLLDRGLVTTTRGKGTFVRPLDIGEAVFRLQEITDLWIDDATVDVLLLEARIIPADPQVAHTLKRTVEDPIVYMRRLIKRKGVTVIYQREYVVYDERRPLVEAQLQINSLEGLFCTTKGAGMHSGRLTIQSVSLDEEAAGFLGVAAGSPAFCLESLFHDFEGRPASWGRFLCRADQFRLTTNIGAVPNQPGEPAA